MPFHRDDDPAVYLAGIHVGYLAAIEAAQDFAHGMERLHAETGAPLEDCTVLRYALPAARPSALAEPRLLCDLSPQPLDDAIVRVASRRWRITHRPPTA